MHVTVRKRKSGTVSVCLALSLVVILGITIVTLIKITMVYSGLMKDPKVFPVVRNTDPYCDFVTYENTWGDDRTFGGDRRHEGCDIMGDSYADGTYPVVSMTDGVVEKMGWLKLGGWRIGIRSDKGIYYYTTYENRGINAVSMHNADLNGDRLISYELDKKMNIKRIN